MTTLLAPLVLAHLQPRIHYVPPCLNATEGSHDIAAAITLRMSRRAKKCYPGRAGSRGTGRASTCDPDPNPISP